MKKLFIGKLAFSTTEASLREFFAEYEPLASVKVITDKFTGRSRGFGFIEIEDGMRASDAIKALNGASLDGNEIVVNEARPSENGGARSPGNYGNSFGNSARPRSSSYGADSRSKRY